MMGFDKRSGAVAVEGLEARDDENTANDPVIGGSDRLTSKEVRFVHRQHGIRRGAGIENFDRLFRFVCIRNRRADQ